MLTQSVELDSEEKSGCKGTSVGLTLCSFLRKSTDRRQRSAELSVHPEPTTYVFIPSVFQIVFIDFVVLTMLEVIPEGQF